MLHAGWPGGLRMGPKAIWGGGFLPRKALTSMDEMAATILIVEDHPTTRSFLADNLVADGYDLLQAEPAAQAGRLIESSCPDLAIIDLGLPDRDGLDVLGHIRDGEP